MSDIAACEVSPVAPVATHGELADVVGMSLFLGSGAVLFGSLLMSYAMLRAQQPVWPPAGCPPPPLLMAAANTLVLAVSSVSMARAQIQAASAIRCAGALGATMALGVLFLVLQLPVWSALRAAPQFGLMRSVFLLLAGCHALHLAAGLGALAWVLPGALVSEPRGQQLAARVRLCAMFWHFLGVAWAALFLTVFVF
ncbi:MAG: heme-copper oxidase subunit III [Candidatus Wallbacteria bacterium]|nr:heme-copper oxidase subunit III [Candidatus Wallbacteria bacterium]